MGMYIGCKIEPSFQCGEITMSHDFFLFDTERLSTLASENTIKKGLSYFIENRVFALDAQEHVLLAQFIWPGNRPLTRSCACIKPLNWQPIWLFCWLNFLMRRACLKHGYPMIFSLGGTSGGNCQGDGIEPKSTGTGSFAGAMLAGCPAINSGTR